MILQLNLDFQHIYCIITSTPLHNAGPNITWYKQKKSVEGNYWTQSSLWRVLLQVTSSSLLSGWAIWPHLSCLSLVQFACEIHLISTTVFFISIFTQKYIIFIFTSEGGSSSVHSQFNHSGSDYWLKLNNGMKNHFSSTMEHLQPRAGSHRL